MEQSVKVVFLTRKWPPAIGGMETYSLELTRALQDSVDLTVRALPGRPDGSAPGVGAILSFGVAWLWRLLLSGDRFDVIHGADMAVWPLVWLGRLRSPRATVVLSAHGTDMSLADRPNAAGTLYRAYMRAAARLLRSARVVANSHATAARAKTLGFHEIEIVPLATSSTSRLEPDGSPERYVLFAGRLVRRKGLSWFVSSVLPLLPPDIELKVAGTIWEECERAALADDRVNFLGPLGREQLAALMARALCVVVPNIPVQGGHFEGFGLVAVEAAAAGGVVVAARIDGLTDAVIDGETGFLVESQDASKWAAKIDEIASWSHERRRAFTSHASRTALARYSWDRVARATIEIYEAGMHQT